MNFSETLYLCTRKRNKDNYNNILKIKQYETNDIILIDGFDDHSSFRS